MRARVSVCIPITYPITCMKLLASSIPGRESAKSVSNSFARPERPANINMNKDNQYQLHEEGILYALNSQEF